MRIHSKMEKLDKILLIMGVYIPLDIRKVAYLVMGKLFNGTWKLNEISKAASFFPDKTLRVAPLLSCIFRFWSRCFYLNHHLWIAEIGVFKNGA